MSGNFRILLGTVALSCLVGSSASAQKPMSGIAAEMTTVATDLSKSQTGKPVQEEQATIVKELDEWIAALEKQCSNCKNGIKKNKPAIPMQDSQIRGGTGGMGDLVGAGNGAKDWAKLSPRERDRILQSMSEGFPPEYRTVLERYYRRLAEEKTVPQGGEKP